MYSDSESQEQDFKVISESMKREYSRPGTEHPNKHFVSRTDMRHCPVTCPYGFVTLPLRNQFFMHCDIHHTIIWKLIYVQLQNMYKQGTPMGALWGSHD